MSTILVIDDEPGIRAVLKDVFEDEKYKVHLAEDGFKGLSLLDSETVDLVILDVWLPNMGGIDVLKRIKAEHSETEVIIISGHANINLAVQAVKMGAFDFLEKPLSLEKTITVVRNALQLENLRKENRDLKDSVFVEDKMIGSSTIMQKILGLIGQSAKSDSRILIRGDNGTGKELIAREIHRQSKRTAGPFIEVNCAAIPENLIESELFGHEKGAFTSAISMRRGKFELAHKGTIFLDEIADMSLSTQAKVLRVLQELKFERIGGEESISVDVRIIAATNKNIEEEIKRKRFREDLYFRLNVIPIHLPPLSHRLDDMDELVEYFMNKFKRDSSAEPKVMTKPSLEMLKKYNWPGNIRELKNFMERVNIMSDEQVISPKTVRMYIGSQKQLAGVSLFDEYDGMNLKTARDSFEKDFILRKLEKFNYNLTKTAQILGIYTSNLHNKIRRYGIETKRWKS